MTNDDMPFKHAIIRTKDGDCYMGEFDWQDFEWVTLKNASRLFGVEATYPFQLYKYAAEGRTDDNRHFIGPLHPGTRVPYLRVLGVVEIIGMTEQAVERINR